jgi:hypothetical protein
MDIVDFQKDFHQSDGSFRRLIVSSVRIFNAAATGSP